MAQSKEFPQYRWWPPKSWTSGRKTGQPTVIVIHTTEGSEGRESAENGAAYDARRTDGTSTHFFVDEDTTVQCVHTWDEAHTARTHGNDVGIQIETCGRAGQTDAQWKDPASAGALLQTAVLCVTLRKKYPGRFPLVHLTAAQLAAGQHGFAGHIECTRAFPQDNGTHTDPGPNYPWARLFDRIRTLESATPPAPLRKVAMEQFTGQLPIIKYGDDDRKKITPEGTYWVSRIQRQLQVDDDGIYGNATAAAVKTMMGAGDGKTVDLPVWIRLYALWGAKPTPPPAAKP